MNALIPRAFQEVRAGYSVDRVLADPALNARFIDKCQELGVGDLPAVINRMLCNLRKRGQLRGIQSKATSFPDLEAYRFAAEMAVRYLERREGVTLDDIVCDPELAAEFDHLAATICPGLTPLQFR